MKRLLLLILPVLAVGAGMIGWSAWYGMHEVASGRIGLYALKLPSGATVWVHRQAYAHSPNHLYLSEDADHCAPYKRGRDYRLPPNVTGSAQSPLLVSISGKTITIHATQPPSTPVMHKPRSFNVQFEQLTPAGTAKLAPGAPLPLGWQRIEVPFGQNDCAL